MYVCMYIVRRGLRSARSARPVNGAPLLASLQGGGDLREVRMEERAPAKTMATGTVRFLLPASIARGPGPSGLRGPWTREPWGSRV